MTIDEAIAKYKEKSKFFKQTTNIAYGLELEQIAEWLEELVMLRLDSCMIHMPERLHLVESGYNKALNDFVNACDNQFTTMYGQRYADMRDIVNIAEQLKAGGYDE